MQASSALRALTRRMAGISPSTVSTTHARRMATQLRPREQKLLEPDPALKEFKSEKTKIKYIKRFGDVLVLAVVAGSTYEIYYRVMARKAAQAEASVTEK